MRYTGDNVNNDFLHYSINRHLLFKQRILKTNPNTIRKELSIKSVNETSKRVQNTILKAQVSVAILSVKITWHLELTHSGIKDKPNI